MDQECRQDSKEEKPLTKLELFQSVEDLNNVKQLIDRGDRPINLETAYNVLILQSVVFSVVALI